MIVSTWRAVAIFTDGIAISSGITVSLRKRDGWRAKISASSQMSITQYGRPSCAWTRRM